MALRPPRLLTNVNQLELLLTVYTHLRVLRRYLVMDEVQYTGARGAEVVALRRLKAVTAPPEDGMLCIGTSATLTDPNMEEDPDLPAKLFAHAFWP